MIFFIVLIPVFCLSMFIFMQNSFIITEKMSSDYMNNAFLMISFIIKDNLKNFKINDLKNTSKIDQIIEISIESAKKCGINCSVEKADNKTYKITIFYNNFQKTKIYSIDSITGEIIIVN